MSLTFDEAKHEYKLDGSKVISVTQALQQAGLIDTQWFTEEARNRGTGVHAAIQYLEEGDLDESTVHETLLGYLDAWKRAKQELNIYTIETEKKVFSKIYGYAGTLDLLARVQGKLTVIDFKTGRPGPTAALQIAAYDAALREMEEMPRPFDRMALWLKPDGDYKSFQYTDRTDITVFRAALAVARWKATI